MRTLILLIFITLFSYSSGIAQWSSNNMQNNAVVIAPNNQLKPKMISDGDGGAIMVWQDYRNGTSNGDIYAQRFDKFGVKQWGDTNGIPIAIKPELERYYDICSDGKGGAFIFWDYNLTTSITYIKAQRVSKSGVKLWTDTGYVAAYSGNRQSTPRISQDNSGGCFFAYLTSELSSTDYQLKANRLDSNGNKLWGTGVFVCQSEGNPTDVSICTSSDNGFVISWGDPRNSIIYDYDVYINKLSQSGVVQWTANGIGVGIKRFAQQYAEVYPDNNGGSYIAWCDRRDSLSNDIYVQRIRANGSFSMPDTGRAICVDTLEQYRPRLTTDGKGGVILGWFDYRNGPLFPFNIDIYGQRVDSTGNIKWTPNGKNICDAQYSQINTAIISDGNFGAIYTWDDRRAGTSTYDIYAQRVDSSGNLLWGADDAPVSIATGNQYGPQIVPALNGAIICFEDTRNGSSNYDIFAQKIMMNGSTILSIPGFTEKEMSFRLYQNYPNPFNPSTIIKWSMSNAGIAKIVIYDLLGRELATLVNETVQPGIYEVNWNASAFPSGVYIYRLQTEGFTDIKRMTLIK